MSERGVFAVDRGIWTDEDFAREPFTEREAFLWLVSEAAWAPRRKRADGKLIELDRGQLCHSVRFMAEAWQWSKSRVDRFLGRIENRDMIRRQTGTRTPALTICNYDKFQRVSLPARDETGTSAGTTVGQERDKLEDIKNIKQDLMSESFASDSSATETKPEVEEQAAAAPRPDDLPAKPKATKRRAYPEAFETLWRAYPTDPNMSKAKAHAVWCRLDATDQAWVMAGVPGFVAYCRKNATYRPVHLERFLRDRRFEGFAPNHGNAGCETQSQAVSADRENGMRALVRRWQSSPQSWPAAMGPRPDEPGCKLPAAILGEFRLGQAHQERAA